MQASHLHPMEEPQSTIPVLERLLLHLHHVDVMGKGAHPLQQTQTGLAEGVGIQRKHVPRAVKRLVEEGRVNLVLQHVPGHRQRLRVHVLTGLGMEEAKRIRASLEGTMVSVDGSEERLLDVIDSGRLAVLHGSASGQGTSNEGQREQKHAPLALAARLLGSDDEHVQAMLVELDDVNADGAVLLKGPEAAFIACLHTALTDAVITPDEEALLLRMREELGPFGGPLKAHVLTLLHDMLK